MNSTQKFNSSKLLSFVAFLGGVATLSLLPFSLAAGLITIIFAIYCQKSKLQKRKAFKASIVGIGVSLSLWILMG